MKIENLQHVSKSVFATCMKNIQTSKTKKCDKHTNRKNTFALVKNIPQTNKQKINAQK